MKVTLNIEFSAPRWLKIVAKVALPVGVLVGAGVAYAGVPHTWKSGDVLTAAALNANFEALDTRKQDKIVAFTQIVSSSNVDPTAPYVTLIDNDATNEKPDAIVIVTSNRSPVGGTTVFHSGSISVDYQTSSAKWTIIHDGGPTDPMFDGEAFNVLVINP